MRNVVIIIYCWAQGYSHEQTKREAEIGGSSLVAWFKLFRSICDKYNSENLTRLGGYDQNLAAKIVEVARYPITEGRTKAKRSSSKIGWLFLGVERNTGQLFFLKAKDSSEATIKKMFSDFIEPGSKIITDGDWAKDVPVSESGYTVHAFLSKGRKNGFVSSQDSSLHTNNCKQAWGVHKRLIQRTKKDNLDSLLHKLMFRNRAKLLGHGYFEAFLLAIQVLLHIHTYTINFYSHYHEFHFSLGSLPQRLESGRRRRLLLPLVPRLHMGWLRKVKETEVPEHSDSNGGRRRVEARGAQGEDRRGGGEPGRPRRGGRDRDEDVVRYRLLRSADSDAGVESGYEGPEGAGRPERLRPKVSVPPEEGLVDILDGP